MFVTSLGTEGAELRPLEPRQAEEFFAHVERGREFIGQHIGFADAAKDLEHARALLQRYADKTAADTGRLFGIWLDDKLVRVMWGPRSEEPRQQRTWFDTDAQARDAYFARLDSLTKDGFIDAG